MITFSQKGSEKCALDHLIMLTNWGLLLQEIERLERERRRQDEREERERKKLETARAKEEDRLRLLQVNDLLLPYVYIIILLHHHNYTSTPALVIGRKATRVMNMELKSFGCFVNTVDDS